MKAKMLEEQKQIWWKNKGKDGGRTKSKMSEDQRQKS